MNTQKEILKISYVQEKETETLFLCVALTLNKKVLLQGMWIWP